MSSRGRRGGTIAAVAAVATIGTVAARAARSAIVAVGVVALAQHGRRTGLVLVDPNREKAEDVLVEAQCALELDDRLGRRGDVEQREMRLAVLLDAERERLQPPGLDLGDGAAERGDLGFDLFRQRFDLLRA